MDYLTIKLPGGSKVRTTSIILMLADTLALLASFAISFQLRFDTMTVSGIYNKYIADHIYSLPIIIAIYLIIYNVSRLYRYAWRFASLEMLWGIVFANTLGIGALIAVQTAVDGSIFPRSVIVIIWIMSIVFIGGGRILLRLLSISQHSSGPERVALARDLPPKKVVIIGGGTQAARVLRGICEDGSLRYDVLGFLDDRPESRGTYIGNVEVLGPIDLLEKMLERNEVDEVIVALPEAGGKEIRKYVLQCRQRKIPVKIVPFLRDTLNGKNQLHLQDFSVEDLLRRPPVKTNLMEVGSYVTGKRVLVTGAGGSIGSELCRQISALKPTSLVLLGHGENSIFEIQKELRQRFPELSDRLHWVIASIADEPRINQV
ncbi:MAG: nucleoside-diphosphate sugar epimerase/dehydratase, partial [Armatimonadota bacterium]